VALIHKAILFSVAVLLIAVTWENRAGGRQAPSSVRPPACTTSDPATVPMKTTVINTGNSLQDDGKGLFVDGVDNDSVLDMNAFALFTFDRNKPDSRTLRSISVDLDKPVPGGGGSPMGVFRNPIAEKLPAGDNRGGVFASYWRLDSNNRVYAVRDIPLGQTVDSERTQIWITSQFDGKRYGLQMGPWSSKCEPFAELRTAGTTKAKITRTGANSYTIFAAPGSIASLSDVTDQRHPIGIGLYFISFEVTASPK
jgi:hypothetical protein